ncbi:MAG: hypothetical protein A2269_07205 [Lentisphaerae bacterium RIFOXYA12_FULL_60_10]|nr:MAG: hypothetical protein A2269_07205 [Lentisphaerae bacterium RIFOXYA12_FULL_60_10]
MATNKQPDKMPARKPYNPPRLKVIELAAPEVLAVGCKMPSGGNNIGSPTCPGGTCAKPKSS